MSTTNVVVITRPRRGLMRMCHGVPEREMNDDLNFSGMVHSDKQISRQTSTIVFSNTLVETLLIKLGDSALYVLFKSYRKTERIQLLAQCYFQTKQALQFAFTLSPQLFSTRETEEYILSSFECWSVCCTKC